MARLNYNNDQPLDLGYHQPGDPEVPCTVYVRQATAPAVDIVLAADEDDEEGRSEWLWVRFPNGDVMLATFPQSDTYCETEFDHS